MVVLFFFIMLFKYKYVARPPMAAANTEIATPYLIGNLNILVKVKLPIIIIIILTSCSITWLIDGSLIYRCPWIYPLCILKIGTTKSANDIVLITSVTSSNVFPPSKSPIIMLDNCGANMKQTKNVTTENIIIILVAN